MTDKAVTVRAEPEENERCCDRDYHIDFTFAFNNSDFSDRVLNVEVMPDQSHYLTTVADSAPNCKRRRKHPTEGPFFLLLIIIFNCFTLSPYGIDRNMQQRKKTELAPRFTFSGLFHSYHYWFISRVEVIFFLI